MPSPSVSRRWVIAKGFKERAADDPFDYPFVSVEGPNTEPVEVIEAEVLRAKLAEMELHDDTGDPFDEGYMAAWNEITEWLADYGETDA